MFDAGSIVGHITLDSSGYQSGANSVKEHSKGMAGEMFKAQVAFELFKKAADFVIDVLKESSKRFIEAERTEAQLNAVLKSTHEIAGMTRTSILALADSLAKQTTFEKDAIVGAENLLLTFTNIGKNIFPQATETVLNMATALGEDLKSASIQLGKALQDPILGVTALRRVGVNFNQTQTDMIKGLVNSGQTLKAQQMILKELNTEFGGSARAVRDTFGGSVAAAKNSWIEFQETLGSYEAKVGRPMAESFITMTEGMTAFLQSAEGLKTIEGIASGVAQAFTIIKLVAGTLIDSIGKNLKSVFDNMGTALGTVGGKGKESATAFTILNSAVYALEIGFTIVTKIVNLLVTQIADLINAGVKSADFLAKLGDALLHMGDKGKWDAVKTAGESVVGAVVKTGSDLFDSAKDIAKSTIDMFAGSMDSVKKMTDTMISEANRADQGVRKAFANEGAGGGSAGAGSNPYAGKSQTSTQLGVSSFAGGGAGAGEHGGGGAMHGAGQASQEQTGAESDAALQNQLNSFSDVYGKIANVASDTIGKMQNAWDQYYANQLTQVDNERQAQEDALDKEYTKKTEANSKSTLSDKQKADKQALIDKEYADKKAKIEKDAKEKSAALKKQQFEADKAASIVQAVISTATAIVSALANAGNPYLGIIMAAVMGALGAVQIAMIASQPTPAFASGGIAQPGWAQVGERGPELVHIGQTSRVYSNSESSGLMGGKQVTQHNSYGDIHGIDDLDRVSESQARILRSLQRSL